MKKLRRKKVYEDILYANCWEDPQIDRKAFAIEHDDVIFSITSGGCNVLTFLLDNPKKVISLDLNPHQNYMLELKIAAFKILSYDELIQFIGVKDSGIRSQLYKTLRSELSTACLDYWDNHPDYIENGIIHSGRYERYMRLLGKTVKFLFSYNLIDKFFNESDGQRRAAIYREEWNSMTWNVLKRILMSRFTMSLLFDKAFFKYLEENFSFSNHFESKFKSALTQLPVRENYFLSYILRGKFDAEVGLPMYLRKENFQHIKKNLNKIEIITNSCQKYFDSLPDNYISKFNFSNIFEWISEDEFKELLNTTIRVARDKAVLTYRNLLVHRERPLSLSSIINSQKETAEELHRQDLSFIYNNYVVEQINKS